MRFFCFHLMPYAHLDIEEADKYPAAWTVLPNRLYDPVKGAELYERYLGELEYADELGYDGVCVNEHHQTAYGLMATPGVLAGALARTVTRGEIAVLGRALPLINLPQTVAEEFAILDNLTRGRLIAGFVRGIGSEYHTTGVNPGLSHERFHEAHDLILRAWTETGPFAFEGKHYHFDYVNTWPRPYRKPHPPIWIPSQGSAETIEWAAAKKYVYCQTYSPFEAVARFFGMYREEAEKNGYTASEDQLAWAAPIYVAETDEQAYRECARHLETFANKFLRMPLEMLLPPYYTSMASYKRIQAAKITSGMTTADSMIEKGVVIVGSPATVRAKIEEYYDKSPFGTLLQFCQFGTLPEDLTRKSMALMAKEVIPHFRDKSPAERAAAAAPAGE